MMKGLAAYCAVVVVLVLLHCDAANSRSTVSTGSVTPRSASAFAEREESRYYVIHKQGTELRSHSTARENGDLDEFSVKDRKKMKQDLEHIKNTDTGEAIRKRRSTHRHKRFLDVSSSRRWPNAKVPYSFDASLPNTYRQEALAAMRHWEMYTCIRFPFWVVGQTRTQYGLPDESHLQITLGEKCSATQGNVHNPNGQWNSCCNRSTCLHELGHSLGLWHEHQSYQSHDFLRQNYDKISSQSTFDYVPVEKYRGLSYQYDITNLMHYSSQTTMHLLYEDLRPLMEITNRFYAYKDVSLSHDCHGQYCSSFTQECHNDGFVNLVDGVCACLCPPGLDPLTGCATTITAIPTSSQWPAGNYAMFAPKTGCPDGSVFATGSWEHYGKAYNKWSNEVSVGGDYTEESFRYEFCVKSNSSDGPNAPTWSPGRYCVLRSGGQCPADFTQGFIKFDDNDALRGMAYGTLPDGQFDANTKLIFCCRDDGFTDTPLYSLPNTKNLVLFPNYHDQTCQEVAGMKWTQGWLKFDSLNGDKGYGGEYPYGPTGVDDLTFYYCHYTPVNFNCGGSITLSQGTQPSAVITSPSYPSAYGKNLECNWMIKTENPDDNILLNFQDFRLTASGSTCQDTLEIRTNMQGQPGIRYCGDGLTRTIRSLKNVIMLTLQTDGQQVSSDTGFKVNATLFSPATNECYEPSTKGIHYRGTMDYTRSMRLCLNWTSVQNCYEHTFNTSDLSNGQEKNYCRNPDNTAMPWCYTAANGCERDYCDVCNNERDYDRTLVCSPVVCSGSRDSILSAGCAAYCHLTPPAAPVRAQTCSSPPVLTDATIVGSPGSSYHVGETVTYSCKTGAETATITCLSHGQWTPLGSVCGSCSPGWKYWSGSCYKLFEVADGVNYEEAEQRCHSLGATVASTKTAQESKFVSNLRGLQQLVMWIGADDRDQEGTFRWPDGDLLNWTDWKVVGTAVQPNNEDDQDCVMMDPPFRGAQWNDMDCRTDFASLFVCEYSLSARVNCVDRADECSSLLGAESSMRAKYPDFADQQCARSCGICSNGSSVKCNVTVPINTRVVSPQGQQNVSMGTEVNYQCVAGTTLIGGQLSLVCGDAGQFNGELPVCEDPDNTIQDSSDLALIFRPDLPSSNYSFLGVGAKYTINRHGVIKCWKYYSPAKGYSFFQVWRDDPTNANNFLLVGENQVKTQGNGVEIFCVPEADWIKVQPGDHLGLWEGTAETRGQIGYTSCGSGQTSADYNVTRSSYATYGDFSTRVPTTFSYSLCYLLSYKAVIYPVPDTAPTAVPTHQHPLVTRAFIPYSQRVNLGGGSDYVAPFDGVISQIEVYAAFAGRSALQVWRPRPDKGNDSFELVGQQKLDLTSNFTAGVQVWSIPEGQRINVRQGDILGLYSYADGGAGIQYTTLCALTDFPEGGPSRQSVPFDADATRQYDVISIPLSSVACQAYSYRAIVSKAPNRPTCNTAPVNANVTLVAPAGKATVPWGADVLYECPLGYLLTQGALRLTCGQDGNLIGGHPVCQDASSLTSESSDVPLIARPTTQWHSYAFLLTGYKTIINRKGIIKQWRLYSNVQGGLTVFQVWRPVPNVADSYVLVGQTPVVTTAAGAQTWNVPEQDWIPVQLGDILGIWEPNDPSVAVRGGVGYDTCTSTDFSAKRTTAANSRPDYSYTYPTAFTDGGCRVFSLRAVIFPLVTRTVRATNQMAMISRTSKGWSKYLHFGDSSSYIIPIDGKIKQWQFYTDSAGEAALQVWRKISGDSFLFVGQTIINLASGAPLGVYNWTLSAGQEITVRAGDYTGLWYGATMLGIPYQGCTDLSYPEGAQQRRTLSSFTASTLTAGSSTMSVPLKTSFTCYSASFRAVVTP